MESRDPHNDEIAHYIETQVQEASRQDVAEYLGIIHQEEDDYADVLSEIATDPQPSLSFQRGQIMDSIKTIHAHSGFLEKKSPSLLMGWQVRYFALEGSRLTYFRNKGDEKMKGIIDFDIAQCSLTVTDTKQFTIQMAGCPRVFHLRALSTEDFQAWTFKLSVSIEHSMGHRLKLVLAEAFLGLKPWRFGSISEERLIKTAQIGDVLLFRGKLFGAKLTRSYTSSKFDHVAIILKFEQEKEQVFFFDSTSNGVAITRWNKFRLYKAAVYSHIFYRRLNCKRDEETLRAMEQFITQTVGSNYKISLRKVLFKRGTLKSQKDN